MQKTIIGIISLLLLAPMAFAGVSYNPNPIKLSPGESKDIIINLQNSEDKTVVLLLQWIEGEGIAKIIGDAKYTIPPRSYDTNARIKVSIPQNANPGDAYKIKLQVKTAPEGSKQIEITAGYFIEIPVVVVAESPPPQSAPQEQPAAAQPAAAEIPEESTKQNKTLIAVIAVILIALVVLVIILMRKKK